MLKCEIGKGDGSDRGDQVAVVAADGTETLAAGESGTSTHSRSVQQTWGVGQGGSAQDDCRRRQRRPIRRAAGPAGRTSGDSRWRCRCRRCTAKPVILTHANHAETPAPVDLAHPQGNRRAGLPGGHRPELFGRYTSFGSLNGARPSAPPRPRAARVDSVVEACLPLTAEAMPRSAGRTCLRFPALAQDCFQVRRCGRVGLYWRAGGSRRRSTRLDAAAPSGPMPRASWFRSAEIEAAVRFQAAGGESGNE